MPGFPELALKRRGKIQLSGQGGFQGFFSLNPFFMLEQSIQGRFDLEDVQSDVVPPSVNLRFKNVEVVEREYTGDL